MSQRTLTELEEKFLQEAKDGFFETDIDQDGKPIAYGAPDTDNLFSMEVVQEKMGPVHSMYYLKEEEFEE